ncbi:hypothetical protein BsWGS_06995 [Bradybaena similaris]
MWLRYLFLISGVLLVFADDAAVSLEETLDDVEDAENNEDIWVVDPGAINQESVESEGDDRDLNADDVVDQNTDDDGDLNTDDDNDEPADTNVNDEDADDRDTEHPEEGGKELAEDRDIDKVQSTIFPETKPAAHIPPDLSNGKKGQVVKKKGKHPSRGKQSQRDQSTNNKGSQAGIKSTKFNANNDTDIDRSSKANREGAFRKKRLSPSSASPSIQLIIIVVGGVLACVLITGFIRWRVRKRLNEKKLSRMDNLAVYRSRMALPKTSIMDTIYECECEDRLTTMRAQNTDQEHATDDSSEGCMSKEDELCCSHKFDKPPSMASSRHYDSHSYLSYHKSSKEDREFDRVYGSKKHSTGHRRHHSHKSRYSRHHRRKRHEKTHSKKTDTNFPTTDACTEEDVDNITCSTSLLEQTDTTEAERTVTNEDPVTETVIPVEEAPVIDSQSGSIIDSVLNTWRSLSFNRDWVGRMWQEKHNVRCISDVLRNASSGPGSEDSSSDSQTSDEDLQNQSRSASSEEQNMVSATADAESVCGQETVVVACNSADSTVITLFSSEQVPEHLPEQSGLNEQSVAEVNTSESACVVVETVSEADLSQSSRGGSLLAFHSCSDYSEEPPEYESLLDSQSYAHHSMPHSSADHLRHHRRHRRKRPEGRGRNNRHMYSRVPGVDSSHTDPREPETPHNHEEHTSLKCAFKSNEVPSNARLEAPSDDLSTACSPDINDDPNRSHHVFTNSPSHHSLSSVAAPFVPQEGIVLEQLSDGAQIIYLPPPTLPSYHNDTPPPYQK